MIIKADTLEVMHFPFDLLTPPPGPCLHFNATCLTNISYCICGGKSEQEMMTQS